MPQPATDEFTDNTVGLQWQWNGNFKPHWLEVSKGQLILKAMSKVPDTGNNLWMTPNLMLQKLPAQTFQVRSKLRVPTAQADIETGLLLFGKDYAWLGIKTINNAPHLVYVQCRGARTGCNESVHDYGEVNHGSIEIRYILASDATAVFAYRFSENEAFTVAGEQFKARRGRWVGAKTGVFAVGESGASARYDYVRFLPMHREGL